MLIKIKQKAMINILWLSILLDEWRLTAHVHNGASFEKLKFPLKIKRGKNKTVTYKMPFVLYVMLIKIKFFKIYNTSITKNWYWKSFCDFCLVKWFLQVHSRTLKRLPVFYRYIVEHWKDYQLLNFTLIPIQWCRN